MMQNFASYKITLFIGIGLNLMWIIRFVQEFIPIVYGIADTRSIADFISNLYDLVDRSREEINSIIDIRM